MKLERVTKRVFLGDDDSIYFRLADVERIRDMFNALLVEARS